MTDKELHKLNRRKLLEMLITQSEELEAERARSAAMTASNEEANRQVDYLKSKLDAKDETIRTLRTRLEAASDELTALRRRLDGPEAKESKRDQLTLWNRVSHSFDTV